MVSAGAPEPEATVAAKRGGEAPQQPAKRAKTEVDTASSHRTGGPRGPVRSADLRGGVIFLCNDATEGECLSRMLFALPIQQAPIVREIRKGEHLILLINTSRAAIIGPFVSDSHGGRLIDHAAFGGRFPCQVRVAPLFGDGTVRVMPRSDLVRMFGTDVKGRFRHRVERSSLEAIIRRLADAPVFERANGRPGRASQR